MVLKVPSKPNHSMILCIKVIQSIVQILRNIEDTVLSHFESTYYADNFLTIHCD